MSEIIIDESTRELLEEPLLDGQDTDAKIRALLKAEYLRRLAQYHRQDRNLSRKYGMDFESFVAQRVVARQGYTWEVEQDAMDWETAIGGISTMEKKLGQLQDVSADHPD